MKKHENRTAEYLVFKEQFVVCWSGIKKQIENETYYSRVSIEMITEQVKLFYSTLDEVNIHYNNNSFIVTEYITLGINNNFKRYQLQKKIIHFYNNGNYKIASKLIFKPPLFNKKTLFHIYNSNLLLTKKLTNHVAINEQEKKDSLNLVASYLILKLNGFNDAEEKLRELKLFFKNNSEIGYHEYKEALRILRKIKYQ